jgi:cyclohexa-1,5-dienecarbonyl-CoA hydratase
VEWIGLQSADGVAFLTLRHPPLNILTQAVLGELRRTLAELESTPDLRVLVIGAEGRHFSAGADVGEHLPPRHREMIPDFIATIRQLLAFPAPVIAAVRGKCLGGGFELVQVADLVIAGRSASFGQPEIALGLLAPAACALLPARCSYARAAELLLCGDAIDAAAAHECGLVAHVVPDDEVDSATHALAARMARHSAAALRLTKRAMRLAGAHDSDDALRASGALYLDELMSTHDALEGVRAFLEKRAPEWTNA